MQKKKKEGSVDGAWRLTMMEAPGQAIDGICMHSTDDWMGCPRCVYTKSWFRAYNTCSQAVSCVSCVQGDTLPCWRNHNLLVFIRKSALIVGTIIIWIFHKIQSIAALSVQRQRRDGLFSFQKQGRCSARRSQKNGDEIIHLSIYPFIHSFNPASVYHVMNCRKKYQIANERTEKIFRAPTPIPWSMHK